MQPRVSPASRSMHVIKNRGCSGLMVVAPQQILLYNIANEVHQKDTISRILWFSDWLHNTTSAGNSIFVTNHNTTSGGRSIM